MCTIHNIKIDDQRSCKTRLEQLVHDTISNLDGDVNRGHKLTYLIIMDFVKVFDEVPHRMLLCKVRKRARSGIDTIKYQT